LKRSKIAEKARFSKAKKEFFAPAKKPEILEFDR